MSPSAITPRQYAVLADFVAAGDPLPVAALAAGLLPPVAEAAIEAAPWFAVVVETSRRLQEMGQPEWLDRARRLAVVAAAEIHDQAVEEVRQDPVAACHRAGFAVPLQQGRDVGLVERELRVGQPGDLHDLGVAEVQHVADAAHHVIVDHGVHRRRRGQGGRRAV